jgi:hypothetical protein
MSEDAGSADDSINRMSEAVQEAVEMAHIKPDGHIRKRSVYRSGFVPEDKYAALEKEFAKLKVEMKGRDRAGVMRIQKYTSGSGYQYVVTLTSTDRVFLGYHSRRLEWIFDGLDLELDGRGSVAYNPEETL